MTARASRTNVSDWEMRELQCRARSILDAYPPGRWWWGKDGRQARLRYLAADYGINLRTLYRYLRRDAA